MIPVEAETNDGPSPAATLPEKTMQARSSLRTDLAALYLMLSLSTLCFLLRGHGNK